MVKFFCFFACLVIFFIGCQTLWILPCGVLDIFDFPSVFLSVAWDEVQLLGHTLILSGLASTPCQAGTERPLVCGQFSTAYTKPSTYSPPGAAHHRLFTLAGVEGITPGAVWPLGVVSPALSGASWRSVSLGGFSMCVWCSAFS